MRRNVYTALSSQLLIALLGIGSSILVARMMQPAEFGVFSIATAIIALLSVIQGGLSQFLLYSRDGDMATRRSVFGFAILVTGGTIGLIFAANPLIRKLYEDPGVARVAMVLPISILITLLTMPVSNMLAREERFGLINLGATASSFAISLGQVSLVWLGYSYMGLAYATILGALAQMAVLFIKGREHILFRPSFRNLKQIASFGTQVTISNVLVTMTAQSAQAIIGSVGSIAQAALFGRANTIGRIYSQTIPRALDPLIQARIAAIRRAGGDGLDTLIQSNRYMLTVSAAFFGFSAVSADLIVPLVYGAQWSAASPAMVIISLSLIVWPLTSPVSTFLIASDKIKIVLRNRLFNLILRASLLLLLTPYGLFAAAFAILGSAYFNTAQLFHALQRHCGVDLKAYMSKLLLAAFTGLAPALATLALRFTVLERMLSGWALLGALTAIMAVLSLVSLIALRHPLVNEFAKILGSLKSRGKAGGRE